MSEITAARIYELDQRRELPDERARQAFKCLEPLIRDLPTSETYLLAPQAVEAWQLLRDVDPECFLAYISQVRSKCGNGIAQLVQARIGAPTGAGPGSRAALPGFTPAAIWGDYTPPRYLVKRLLGPGEVTVLFGQSGHFKSALAVDLSLCVASGQPFHEIRTRKAGVLYVAGEGHGGLKKRIRAWLIAHEIDAAAEQPAVFVTDCGADLLGNAEQLRLTVEQAAKDLGLPIELVVFDTLAANFGQGDENHASDMSAAIASAKRAALGAAVLLVHHTGHGSEARERGSYSLIAAADYRLCASYDELSQRVEIKFLKVKDDERPEPLAFGWRRVPLEWRDEDGEELTSVVLDRVDASGASVARQSLGKNQQLALRILQRLYDGRVRYELAQGNTEEEAHVLRSAWRTECKKAKLEHNRFAEAVDALAEKGCVSVQGEHVKPLKSRIE